MPGFSIASGMGGNHNITLFCNNIQLVIQLVAHQIFMFNLKIARTVLGIEALSFLTGCASQRDIICLSPDFVRCIFD